VTCGVIDVESPQRVETCGWQRGTWLFSLNDTGWMDEAFRSPTAHAAFTALFVKVAQGCPASLEMVSLHWPLGKSNVR
jgi:hypothetical protein